MTLGQNSPGRDLKNRYLLVGAAMMVGLLALVIQAYRLQITRHEEFTAKSEANFIKEIRLRADRGMIRDSRGEILVDNRPSYDLFVTPAFCKECRTEVLPKVAQLLSIPPEEVEAIGEQIRAASRKAPFVPVPIKIDLTRDESDRVFAHNRDLPGVEVTPVPHRNYRTGTVMSHVLGYMNEITQEELDRMAKTGRTGYFLGDFIGRRGLERYFDTKLRGADGVRKEVVNARGGTVPGLADLIHEDARPPTPGNNIVLSIDMRLQAEAERAFPGLAGAVVAVDVHTGFIRALVSRPGFDPNMLTGRVTPTQMAALSKDPLQPMVFRPTMQHYSPGSTFKIFTALAALRTGQFHTHSSIYCPGGYRLGSRVWRCDLESGHGWVPMRTALQKSCNVFFYRLGDVIGIDAIAKMGREFGFGSPTGVGVVAEVPGIMPDERYYEAAGGYQKGMALNSAIGQGDDNVTPMQLAMAYATLANGGTLFQPQLVERIESPSGEVLERFEPKVVRTTEIDPEHRRFIIDALKAVVNEPGGTGGNARLKDVVVAGKTGTAQTRRLGAVRLKAHQLDYWARDNAWFASLAPAEDPEIVVIVLNEHAGFGASGAAPVAGAVLKKYFELKALDAGGGPQVAAAPGAPVSAEVPPPSVALKASEPAKLPAPGITSAVVADAVRAAQNAADRAAEVKSAPAPVEPPPAPARAPGAAVAVTPVDQGEPPEAPRPEEPPPGSAPAVAAEAQRANPPAVQGRHPPAAPPEAAAPPAPAPASSTDAPATGGAASAGESAPRGTTPPAQTSQ